MEKVGRSVGGSVGGLGVRYTQGSVVLMVVLSRKVIPRYQLQ